MGMTRMKLQISGLAIAVVCGNGTACGGDMAARDAIAEVFVAEERVLEIVV
jgi:hypothetical protein